MLLCHCSLQDQHMQSVLMLSTVHYLHNDIFEDASHFFFVTSIQRASQKCKVGLQMYTSHENYVFWSSWPGSQSKHSSLMLARCNTGAYCGSTKGTVSRNAVISHHTSPYQFPSQYFNPLVRFYSSFCA